jgi:hypothetical protein
MDTGFVGAERDRLRRSVKTIDRRLGLDSQAEHRARFDGAVVQEQIVLVQWIGTFSARLAAATPVT